MLARLPLGWQYGAAAVLLLFLVGFTARADSLIVAFAEDEGLYAQLQRMAAQLPSDAPILAHGYKTWVAPLYVAFDHRIIPIDLYSASGRKVWDTWAAAQAAKHEPAYLLAEVDPDNPQPNVAAQFTLSRVFTEPTCEPLPRKLMTEQTTIDLYKVDGQLRVQADIGGGEPAQPN